jgi:hypothetical protein
MLLGEERSRLISTIQTKNKNKSNTMCGSKEIWTKKKSKTGKVKHGFSDC